MSRARAVLLVAAAAGGCNLILGYEDNYYVDEDDPPTTVTSGTGGGGCATCAVTSAVAIATEQTLGTLSDVAVDGSSVLFAGSSNAPVCAAGAPGAFARAFLARVDAAAGCVDVWTRASASPSVALAVHPTATSWLVGGSVDGADRDAFLVVLGKTGVEQDALLLGGAGDAEITALVEVDGAIVFAGFGQGLLDVPGCAPSDLGVAGDRAFVGVADFGAAPVCNLTVLPGTGGQRPVAFAEDAAQGPWLFLSNAGTYDPAGVMIADGIVLLELSRADPATVVGAQAIGSPVAGADARVADVAPSGDGGFVLAGSFQGEIAIPPLEPVAGVGAAFAALVDPGPPLSARWVVRLGEDTRATGVAVTPTTVTVAGASVSSACGAEVAGHTVWELSLQSGDLGCLADLGTHAVPSPTLDLGPHLLRAAAPGPSLPEVLVVGTLDGALAPFPTVQSSGTPELFWAKIPTPP